MEQHLYLAHHGIKGQRWGVRRFRNKDGSLTNAGKERYGNDSLGSNSKPTRREKKITKYEEKYRKKGLDEQTARAKAEAKYKRRRAALIIGATVVAAYATYKFVDSGQAHQLAIEGQSIVNRVLGSDTEVFKKNDALRSASGVDEIMSTVVSRINPEYGQLGTTSNCRRCTFAYEMSRRGYDVRATKTLGGTGQATKGFARAIGKRYSLVSLFKEAGDEAGGYFTPEFSESLERLASRVGSAIKKGSNPFELLTDFPNGARGEVSMAWTCGGAHSMAWEIIDGAPVIIDCQTQKAYSSFEELGKLGSYIDRIAVNRLDNVELDTHFLERWLANA